MASHDDIVVEIEEAPAREPVVRPRPDTRAYALAQAGAGPAAEPEVYLHVRVLERALGEARANGRVESGGLLAGEHCRDPQGQYVSVLAALPARLAHQTATSLTFTQAAWQEMLEERERQYPAQEVVGWYHTHPGMRVFLSGPDRFIHHHFFRRPQDVALVVDPVNLEWGVFRWHGDCLELAGRFFIYGEGPGDGARLPAILQTLGSPLDSVP